MDIRYNFNRLHSNLTSKFENVTVIEKSNRLLGNYVEITINEQFLVKMVVPLTNLVTENVTWFYYSNPIKESEFITRSSTLDSTPDIVKDIIDNKRFDSEYINSVN